MAAQADFSRFELPDILDNPSGWGPSTVPAQFEDIPFAPFNKNDVLGRVSDWQTPRFFGRGRPQAFQGSGGFGFKDEEDETSFTFVDNTPKFKPKDGRRRYKKFSVSNRRRRGRGYRAWGRPANTRGGKGKKMDRFTQKRRWGFNNGPEESKEQSLQIKEEWGKAVDTIGFDELAEEKCAEPVGETLVECGNIQKYDTKFDRVTPKQHVKLQRFEKIQHFTATTSADPVLQELMEKEEGNVYANDTILGVLMAANRSVVPWDLVVVKRDGVITIDRRNHSHIDYLTVNENWNEVLEVDHQSANHADNLSMEATFINHNFSQHVLTGEADAEALERENPFLEALAPDNKPAAVGYRYRRFQLDKFNIVCRTSCNGYLNDKNGDRKYLTIRALNEFNSKFSGNVDWRQKLESQTGAVLATEMKNNSNKLARWTAEMLLAGTDEMRLGFISRIHSADAFKHELLMVQRTLTPKQFATSMKCPAANLWGSLRAILHRINAQPDGAYLLMKDANEPHLVMYSIAEDEFAHEDEEDEEEGH